MAKRGKDESITEFKKRISGEEIMDTSAGGMMLDINVKEEGKTTEGLLTLQRDYRKSDNITVSWRIPERVLSHAKRVAMEMSLKDEEEIHYQKLVIGCFLDKYPMSK